MELRSKRKVKGSTMLMKRHLQRLQSFAFSLTQPFGKGSRLLKNCPTAKSLMCMCCEYVPMSCRHTENKGWALYRIKTTRLALALLVELLTVRHQPHAEELLNNACFGALCCDVPHHIAQDICQRERGRDTKNEGELG